MNTLRIYRTREELMVALGNMIDKGYSVNFNLSQASRGDERIFFRVVGRYEDTYNLAGLEFSALEPYGNFPEEVLVRLRAQVRSPM